jgi:polysaccharide biosynthesis/export protein
MNTVNGVIVMRKLLSSRFLKSIFKSIWHMLAALLIAVSWGSAATAQTKAIVATAPVEVTKEYVLAAGDVLKISVFQNAELSLEARLSESGTISYPLLGSVKLGGLSVSAAEKALADGLRTGNFVKSPQVSLLVMQVRGHQASVLGMVNKPGRYPLEVAGVKLSDLIALSGGIAQGGSDAVVHTGVRGGKVMRQELDLPSLFGGASAAADPVVQNGDVVYVDRMPVYYIYGEVQRAGALRLERGMTVMQGLAQGGGLTQRGTEKGMRIHRRDAKGNLQVLQLTMDSPLQQGDVIYVRESLF